MTKILCKFQFVLYPFYWGLASVLLHLVTIQRLHKGDGQSLYGYGLPWSWLKFGEVSSLEYTVHLPAMVCNWILNFFVVFLIFKFVPIKERHFRLKWILNLFGILMTFFSVLFVFVYGEEFLLFESLFDAQYMRFDSLKVHFGPSRPYGP